MILILSSLGVKSLKVKFFAVHCHETLDESVMICKVVCCTSQLLYQQSMENESGLQ